MRHATHKDFLVCWDEAEIELKDGSIVMADIVFIFTVHSEPGDPGSWDTPPVPESYYVTDEKVERVTYFDDEGNEEPFIVGELKNSLVHQFWKHHTEQEVLDNIEDRDRVR